MNSLAAIREPSRRLPSPALVILAGYVLAAAGVWLGWWGTDWSALAGSLREPPSGEHWLGTNRLGQDILSRLLAGTATAFEVGALVAVASTALGGIIGGLSGYFAHRWIDSVLMWLTGTIDAIPFYLFVAALAVAFGDTPGAMQVAMILTFWTPTARVARTESMRLRERDFIAAARVAGLGPWRILQRHILPNAAPLLLVQTSLIFVAAVKAEVVLSFLGIGLRDSISWGVMIAEASQEILVGHYTNFIAASMALFGLVFSINQLLDRLQERLDPRTRMAAMRRLA